MENKFYHLYKIARQGKNHYDWIKVLRYNDKEETFTVKGTSGNIVDLPDYEVYTEVQWDHIKSYMLRKFGKTFNEETMSFENVCA